MFRCWTGYEPNSHRRISQVGPRSALGSLARPAADVLMRARPSTLRSRSGRPRALHSDRTCEARRVPRRPYLVQSLIASSGGNINALQLSLKRPLAISIIGWLSILSGAICVLFLVFVGLYADSGSSSISWLHRFRGSGLFVGGTVASLAGGVLVLKRSPRGRWMILASIAFFPLELSGMGAMVIAVHGLALIVCGFFLFRQQANAYFRGGEHDPSARLS